ncbi:MAG TPA: DUF4270 family protein [Chitinophagaceae bacterium]
MKKRQLALTLGSFITGLVIIFSSCKKINQAIELGGDLIPPIDNIHTFDTSITVEAYNDLFTLSGADPLKEDSLTSSYTDEHFLGFIDNDIFFGKTDAQMFLELKPVLYKYTFANKPDSLHIDSVVLVLDYVETYGDSIAAQTLNVYEVDQSADFRVDTSYFVRRNTDITYTNLLGSRTIIPASLKDSVKAYQDTTSRQLRIRLSDAFGQRLLNYDTAGANDAYSSDSAFRSKFKGFAVKSVAGNAIMGFNLQGANTKLAIYYRYDKGGPGNYDTTVDYFRFKPFSTFFLSGSASHNYIGRDYSGYPIQMAQGGTTPDPFVYIQNTPGSFATIKIPALGNLTNRVVHRAELIAEQAYDPSDAMFSPPAFMYLDAYNPLLSGYNMIIPYDLLFDGSGNLNLGSFGVAPVNALDGAGNVVKTWKFNLTRYVQHVVNDTEPVYDLRLFSPYYAIGYYRPFPGAQPSLQRVFINPTIAKGRVRLAGNTGPLDPNPQRMRLRIVYSKL